MSLQEQQKLVYFQKKIWDFYHTHGRKFPWRNITDPYKVVISEVMLQQTQTYRVLPKYELFIETFPTFEFLASAQLRDVLSIWQGLGYNRRGKYLHELAQTIVKDHSGILPQEPDQLIKLPGIGAATASSITAFAFNKPTIFIETNIRTVFIHEFFHHCDNVYDKQLFPLIEKTVDQNNPREWYYALMDYGVMLKATLPNPSRKSRHHVSQSKFEGSDRQIRGAIIRHLTDHSTLSMKQLKLMIKASDERLDLILEGLMKEQMIKKNGQNITI